MARRVYLDFLRSKLLEKDLRWFFKRALQYFLIHASYLAKRPLCGPIVGFLITNYTCNYHCSMCNLPLRDKLLRDNGLKELTTAQLKRMIKDLSELGVSGIAFTGGEPLLRKDILELIKYTKEIGLIANLNTNGFYLNEEMTKRLFDCSVDSINISLDGVNRKTHDDIRGYDGAFDKVVTAIKNINAIRGWKKARPRLKVIMVINQKNVDEVIDLVRFVTDLNVDAVEFIPEQLFYVRSPDDIPSYDDLFFKKLDKVVDFLLHVDNSKINIENSESHLKLFQRSFRNEKPSFRCYAGYHSYVVDCFGEVYPCIPWVGLAATAGNIADTGLKEIWYSNEYNAMRKRISKCDGCYLNCQAELSLLFKMRN